MKTELDMVRGEQQQEFSAVEVRKQLNEAAHALVHDAVLQNDLPALAEKLAEMMLTTARTLMVAKVEPDLENFVYAAAEVVANARKAIDDALRFDNKDDLKLGAVMMEIVLKGIAATLNLPLEKLMREVLLAETCGSEPDISGILEAHKEGA